MRHVDIRTPLTVCGLKVSTVLFWHSSWMDMLLDLMVNATLEYLEEMASSKEPFYLFHSFTTPHAGGIGNVS